MKDNNRNEPANKKGFSNNFFLFFVLILLLAITIQNMFTSRIADVSFSYQLEHLENLGLINSTESTKVAVTDELVHFKGHFVEHLSEESKNRFKYLSSIKKLNDLKVQEEALNQELNTLQQDVYLASILFLELTGKEIPVGGYKVIDSTYNTRARSNEISIFTRTEHKAASIIYIQKLIDNGEMQESVKALKEFLSRLQSPILAVSNENLKQKIKDCSKDLEILQVKSLDALAKSDFLPILHKIQTILQEMEAPAERHSLSSLRSIRLYRDALHKHETLVADLDAAKSQLDSIRAKVGSRIWFFNDEELSNKALEAKDPESFSNWFIQAKKEFNQFEHNKGALFKAPDQPRNKVLEKRFRSEEPTPDYFSYFFPIFSVLAVLFVLYLLFNRQVKGMGGGNPMGFGKSPARMITSANNKITFSDVAGADEAKEELQEVVEFLKNPAKFTALGATIPKGVLCVGPPGTGKTLIARAVAGEANRPFFLISGSDFVEMFVGVGASRIRSLFEDARKASPCIIFIDEIDAVGRHRGVGVGGGHDEREQTLNQLLVEMDGFDPSEGIIIMAATNRPNILDKALLRPGRFYRQLYIGLPDVKGRMEILKVHAKKIKLDASVNLMNLARKTPGRSGADLKNILNEGALLAANRGHAAVSEKDIMDAADKVMYGKERRSLEVDLEEKRTTAIHEAGHAIVGLKVEKADPIEKVTIIPRGSSLGATHFLPEKNKLSYWRKELLDELAVLMGGRCAEEVFVHDVSSGASQDISQATAIARNMVCRFGMNEDVGIIAYEGDQDSSYYKPYSEETARHIDKEVKLLVDNAYAYAKKIISEHEKQVITMTDALLEFETLDKEDIAAIMDATWDPEKKKAQLEQTIAAANKEEGPKKEEILSSETPRNITPNSSLGQA